MNSRADTDRVSTHWHNCYRSHLECANVEIERLRRMIVQWWNDPDNPPDGTWTLVEGEQSDGEACGNGS